MISDARVNLPGLKDVLQVRVCQRCGLMLPSDGVSVVDKDALADIPQHNMSVGIVSFGQDLDLH